MSAIEVVNLKVRSLDVDFNEVSWEIESFAYAKADILDYTFTLLRSQGPEGPFDEITPPTDDQYFFIDNNLQRGDIYRQYFYKVRVSHKVDGTYKDFGPASHGSSPDLIATELRKHLNLLFKEFAGRRCWVFPARTFGQRCSCWNNTLGKRTASRCLTCFDTGFTRGYMRPVEAWIQFDPSPKATQPTNVGELQQTNTTARMGYYPPVKPRDVIIEAENNRWRVNQVSATQHLRTPVHQEVQLHMVPKGDIEYKLEFDIGAALKDLLISPARAFTNPQNLESFERDEMAGIMDIYNL